MKNVALITGASSGLGREFAKIHASLGNDLVITARRELLDELKIELVENYGVEVIVVPLDLSKLYSAQILAETIEKENIEISYLINNAGFTHAGLFHQQPPNIYLNMMYVNMVSLTELTRLILPKMVDKRSGRILFIASMAAFIPGPNMAVYNASKSYVLSLSEALSHETRNTGVTITALCPNSTATGFAKAGSLEKSKAFRKAADAAKVARYGYRAMMKGKRVAIQGILNKITTYIFIPLLPKRFLMRQTQKQLS
jgi:uncharacterized protein